MRAIRRLLQVVALIGTLLVGALALALIVSQTPWFRDWLRRYIVREAKQYLNGQLAIGRLGGNLLFGVDLADVTVDVSGERVVAVKALTLDYSVFELVSRGLVLNEIRIDQPTISLDRDANGWNLARLVKRQEREANRQGPGRSVSLPIISISDAQVSIQNHTSGSAVTWPSRIDHLNVKAGFEYEPVHYSVNLDQVSFHGVSPDLSVQQLTGKLAVRDDNLYVQGITLETSETSLKIDGVVEHYLATPVLKVTTTGSLSLPELGRLVPAATGYNLHPTLTVKADGPLTGLAVNLDVKSEAGSVRGQLTADVQTPDLAFRGDVDVERLNVAPMLKDPDQRTDLTGHVKLDVTMKTQPADVRAADRMRGTFAFNGPRAVAFGYEATTVTVYGSLAGPRITLDAHATGYGSTATARGFVVTPAPGRPLSFDLRGKADHVDLHNLPATTSAPNLVTNLSVAEYHVSGDGPSIKGSAALNTSTVEGATFAGGTTGDFALTPGAVSYSARGNVSNLDLDRFGGALKIGAIDTPVYDSRIKGSFDVTGRVPRTPGPPGTTRPSPAVVSTASSMTLDASGTLTDSAFMGGRLLDLGYDAHLSGGALSGRANGRVEGINPAPITGRKDLDGKVTGTVNATYAIRDVSAPITPEAVTLDASGTLTDSAFMGGRLPELGYDAHLHGGALSGRANGRFEGFNPAQITGRKELDGKVTGTVNATYAIRDVSAPITPEAVSAEGTATLTQSDIGGLRIDSADIAGRYAAQVGEITTVNVSGPDVKVDASGRLALDRASQSSLTYHVDAINLPELARLAGQSGVGGAAVLDGTMTGNAASLKTTGTLKGSNLAYGDTSALDLNSQYIVTVPELDFAKAQVQATTDATFVAAGGVQLNSVNATTSYDQQRLDFTTTIKEKTRQLDATGQLLLHPDHQEIHLPQFAVRTQGVEWHAAPGSQATVEYGRGRIGLKDVKLVSGDQALDLSGTLALKGEAPAGAIEVHARNVDVHQLETLALQDRGLTGRLNADATISGSTDAPRFDGRLQIDKGAFQTYHYDLLAANLDYRGTRIGIDATLQQSPTESITAKGSVPTTIFEASAGGGHVEATASDQIDLQVTSSGLGLAVLQGLTSQVTNVTGTLDADVHVGGSGRDPHLNGLIDIKNGGFGVPAAGETFSGLTTRVVLQPDRVRIQQFQLLDHNRETLTIAGDLAVHEGQVGAVNVSIDSDNFEILHNELGDVQVQSALKLTGELRRPRIVGDVRVDAGRIEVDRVLQFFYDPYSVDAMPDVVSAERTAESSGSAEEATKQALAKASVSAAAPAAEAKAKAEEDTPPATGGLFNAVALDVHLVIPDNLVLRGKDLRPGGPTGTALGNINITVGGDLRILKDAGGPVAPVGTVKTVRGTYDFQGRRFNLVRDGTIRFIGTPTINPLLDVTATRTIRNTGVEARVHITGTPETPELTLSSNPPLEESDILALIVFNRPVNELGTGERSSLAATAGGIATGFIAAPLGDSIGKALDLDLFEITTTTESGDLGAGVTVGQQIGDRAFVKLRQEFGPRNVSEFMIDYQLARFLRLQATAAPETSGSANRVNQRRVERGGIDLIFFFSY